MSRIIEIIIAYSLILVIFILKAKGEVYFDPAEVSEKEIVDKVNQTGFKAVVIEK